MMVVRALILNVENVSFSSDQFLRLCSDQSRLAVRTHRQEGSGHLAAAGENTSRCSDQCVAEARTWDALQAEAKEKGAALCAEFAVEVMSPSDRLAEQKEKMELGGLIDADHRTVYAYRSLVRLARRWKTPQR